MSGSRAGRAPARRAQGRRPAPCPSSRSSGPCKWKRKKKPRFAGLLQEPSDGLEPSTPAYDEREEGSIYAGLRIVKEGVRGCPIPLEQAKLGAVARAARERQQEPASARASQPFSIGRRKAGLCGRFSKPSDGLEPSTPSLPSSDEAGTAGKAGVRRARKPRKEKQSPRTE